MDRSISRSFRRIVCLGLAMLLLGGCASKYGPQTTTVQYYPQCYSPISELRRAESDYKQTVATGSIVGALVGALGGYLATGKAEGAIVGAAAGTVAGTAVGYAQAESRQSADENRRMASYLSQLDGDISGLNGVTASARLAIQCYDKQFQEALAAYKAGRISKPELQARYAEIRSGSQEAANIMGQVVDSTLEKERQYQQALAQEAKKANRPVPVVEPVKVADTSTRAASAPKKSAKKTSSKTTASARPAKSAGATPLDQMAERTQALSASRQELQQETNEVASLQKSWAADLAAIES